MRKQSWDFGPSAVDKRRAARERRAQDRALLRRRRAELKAAQRADMRRRKEARRQALKESRDIKRRQRSDERRQRLERRKWEKQNRRPMRRGNSQTARDLLELASRVGANVGPYDEQVMEEMAGESLQQAEQAAPPPEQGQPSRSLFTRVVESIRQRLGI